MGHLSIAIIKSEISKNVKVKSFEYLVIRDSNNQFKFFDYEDKATIGGSFDYSFFKSRVIEHFDLEENNEETDSSRFIRFKSHTDYSQATAYQYFLTPTEAEKLKVKINSIDGKGIAYLWKTEKQLNQLQSKWIKSQKFIFEHETPFQEPHFSNDFRSSIRNIVKAKNNNKLIIFAGAGVSVDSNVPNWSQLVEQLRSELDNDTESFNLVGDTYLNERGQKEYQEKIQEILNHGHTNANPIHEKILQLRPLHVVTTNYDTHFEQLIDTGRFQYSVVSKDSDLPYTKTSSLLIKMHGDFDSRNIILTKHDYDNYSNLFPLVEGYVKGLFASKLVLFIGFSFTDPNLDQIVNSVKEILLEDAQRPYLLFIPDTNTNTKSKKKIKTDKEGLKKKGVTVVEFEEDSISLYFKQVCSEEDSNIVNQLSDKGKKTYQFLKVIEEFDLFSDTLENTSVDQQLINSINSFNELGAIPRKTIESISPFRIKRYSRNEPSTNASFSYSSYFELETLNETLLSFLIKLSDSSGDLNFSWNILEANEKADLNKALKLLYNSGVRTIVRKDDTSPKRIKLNPIDKNSQCDCNRCLHDDFKLSTLLKSLDRTTTKLGNTRIHSSLNLCDAYGYFKMGEILKTYDVLIELQRCSWRSKKYVTFFLASYNLTKLKSFAWLSITSPFEETELQEIRLNIDAIDLDKILFELPIDIATYNTLKYIKDNKALVESELRLQDAHKNVIQTYLAYNEPSYWSSGPDYWYNAEVAFFSLWNFYHKNYLFNDQFLDFKNLSNLYIESMIVSYQTNSRYKQRLNSYSPFFVYVFLHYAQPKKIESIIGEYGVTEFCIEDSNQTFKDIIESYDNFIKSAFEESNFFSYRVSPRSSYIGVLQGNSRLADKVRDIFSNFMLLFAHLNLSLEQFTTILNGTLNFLEQCVIFDDRNGLKYFSHFIDKHAKKISDNDLKKIFKYALGDNFWSDQLTKRLSESILKQTSKRNLLGEDYFEKLKWRLTDDSKGWNVRLPGFFPVFDLLCRDTKSKFFELAKPTFKSCDNIVNAYKYNLWSPIENPDIFEFFIQSNLQSFSNFPEYHVASNGHPKGANNFGPWNSLHFVVRLTYIHDLFDLHLVNSIFESINSDMFKWILKPDRFDYSKFKAKWVATFNTDPILIRLSSNNTAKKAIMDELSLNYNEHVAKIYFEKLTN